MDRVVQVKHKYNLTMDQAEAAVARWVINACSHFDMIYTDRGAGPTPHGNNALELYDDNRNGRITCAEARRHGIAPVPRGHSAYQYMDDRNNNGVVCE